MPFMPVDGVCASRLWVEMLFTQSLYHNHGANATIRACDLVNNIFILSVIKLNMIVIESLMLNKNRESYIILSGVIN